MKQTNDIISFFLADKDQLPHGMKRRHEVTFKDIALPEILSLTENNLTKLTPRSIYFALHE